MVRFLSAEWVERFNAALAGVDLTGAPGDRTAVAADRPFTVAQEVAGGPDGPVRTVLTVDLAAEGAGLQLALEDPGERADGDDVTISLDYSDAVDLSRGDLDPAQALGAGRVRVRGDLALLVTSQAVLAAAAGRLAGLSADTTY